MLDEIATYIFGIRKPQIQEESCSLLYGKKKYEKQTKVLIQETYLFCDY